MPESQEHPRIFISVAEQSADEHAGSLIRAFCRLNKTATFHGLAGPAMLAAGCEGLADLTTHSAMALAAVRRIPTAIKLLHRLKHYFRTHSFDAAVMVDSPALNLPIAKLCRRFDIPVLYYIAPQTWAWGPRKWRNARIRRRVNRLACLWPFEEDYFREADIPAVHVGHPSFDRLLATKVDPDRISELRSRARHVITLLPGSRRHVVEEVFPGQLTIAQTLAARFPRMRCYIVAANPAIKQMIEERIALSLRRISIDVLMGDADRAASIRAADLVFVASGTATLEVAYHETPMIVMYNSSRWTYRLLGRWLITTPFLSLPNILAGRQIVPEYMPFYKSVDPIIARAAEWLVTPNALRKVREDLAETIKPLAKRGAAKNAALQLAELLRESK